MDNTLQEEITRVVIVGVDTGEEDFEVSMQELEALVYACNKKVVGKITQKLDMIHKGLYLGSGKVQEVKEFAEMMDAAEVIFDNTLSPSQIRNLVAEIDKPVMDRTNVILDIFAIRAKTREAKLQVETASLQYMLPRLVGMHESLGRQGGASGSLSNKGSGEKKLELDRRRIEKRLAELRKELQEVEKNRMNQRKKRDMGRIPQVALVGYTNAGKSTLLNRLLENYGSPEEKLVLEKDMLFATLETSIRHIDNGKKKPFLLADTVGFIHKLPHNLIKAFHSTLEEVRYSDMLLHVVDFSDPQFKHHMEVTRETLKELEASDIPQIIVYNKADQSELEKLPVVQENSIYMAAGKNIGIDELVEMIQSYLYRDNCECTMLIPYDKGQITSYLMDHASIRETEYMERGVLLKMNCHQNDYQKYKEYLVEE